MLKHALLKSMPRWDDQPWQKHCNGDSDGSPNHHSKEDPEGGSFGNEIEQHQQRDDVLFDGQNRTIVTTALLGAGMMPTTHNWTIKLMTI